MTGRARNGFYPWLVWGLAAAFYCYGFFQRVAPSVMIDELMRDFAVSAAVLGNLSAFYFYAYASLQLPIGVMVDHWGAKRMLIGAALLCAAGSLLFARADDLTMAYLGRLMIGAGAGFTWVGTLKLAAQWLPPRRFAQVTGMTLMMGMIGAVAGQAPLAAAVGVFGWRGALAAAAAFALIMAALIWLIVRDGESSRPVPAPAEGGGGNNPGLLQGLVSCLKTPQSWFASLFGGAMAAPILAFAGLWGVPYLMQTYGLSRPEAAASTSLMLIGWGIGAPLTGWISDRIGFRRLPMLISAVAALAVITALLYIPDLPLAAARALLFLHGLLNGGMVIAFAMIREHNTPEAAGASLGFANTMVMASGAIFQPFIGWLLDLNWDGATAGGSRLYTTENYETAFLSLVVCGVAAIVMALLTRETRCRNVFEK